jgi:hypothetical protein
MDAIIAFLFKASRGTSMQTPRFALISAFALFLAAPFSGASEQFHPAGLSSLPSAAQSSISGVLGEGHSGISRESFA